MAALPPETLPALTRAVDSLAQNIATLKASPGYAPYLGPVAAIAGAIVGAVTGFIGSDWMARRREQRQNDNDRRRLAGALAAELRGFLTLWREIEPPGKPAIGTSVIITWAVAQSYSPVFDTSGPRLLLLGRAVLDEVSACYFKLRRALDNLRMSQRVTEYVQTAGRVAGSIHQEELGRMALGASEGAVATGRRAVSAIGELLPKLEAIAAGTAVSDLS
jgi:hypothetical protein